MNITSNAGILYPQNPKVKLAKASDAVTMPAIRTVPHGSWDVVASELDAVFSELSATDAKYVFVLAPLHKGKIDFDDSFCVYTYEDCFVDYPILTRDNEVCSEEYSYEILLPYIKACFPNAESTAFFAPSSEDIGALRDFVDCLKVNYPECVILLSGTKDCCSMWHQATV